MNARTQELIPPERPAEPPVDDDRLAALLSEIGGEAELELRVYHVLDGKRGYLFNLTGAEAADSEQVLEILAARAGDGDYELWLKDRKTKGIIRKAPVSIGRLQAKGFARLAPTPVPPAAPANVSRDTTSSSTDQLLRALLEQNGKILERLAAPPAAPPAPAKTTLEFATELAAIKDLFAAPAPTQNALELVRDVLKLRDELHNVDGDGDNPLTAAIRTLGPSIVDGVRALQDRGSTKPSRMARAVDRRRAPAQPAEGDAMNPATILRGYLPAVLELARSRVPPAEAGQRIATQIAALPESVANQVLLYLDDVDASDLAKLAPEISKFEQWTNDTLDALFDVFAPEDEPPADDTARGNGVDSAPIDARRAPGDTTRSDT